MLFRSHVAFGAFLYLVLYPFVEGKWWFLLGVVVGSLIVDLDSPKSRVGGYFIFRPFQFLTKHRGMMHSLFFGFVVMVIIAIFQAWVAFGFIVGFLGHLLLDSFTRRKIAFFWPLFKGRYGLGLFKSGGLLEMVIFVLFLIIDIGLLIYYVFF